MLRFGGEDDYATIDPKVNTNVVGGDPIEAAELGFGTAAELREAAAQGVAADGGGRRERRDDEDLGFAAAITHGADGMELATPDGDTLRAAPPQLGAYPVGSGDAALGGFLAALDAGAPWPDALATAVRAATANARVPGAGRLLP